MSSIDWDAVFGGAGHAVEQAGMSAWGYGILRALNSRGYAVVPVKADVGPTARAAHEDEAHLRRLWLDILGINEVTT